METAQSPHWSPFSPIVAAPLPVLRAVPLPLTLYVLKLNSDKYYVGTTSNILQRVIDHYYGKGSEWTKLYPPVDILSIAKDKNRIDETSETIRLMSVYGIANVRGGAYCEVTLGDDTIRSIFKVMAHNNDSCYTCGSQQHYTKDCRGHQLSSPPVLLPTPPIIPITLPAATSQAKKRKYCARCDRTNHTIDKCYAKTYKDKSPIVDDANASS
jgi:hypothetical protein